MPNPKPAWIDMNCPSCGAHTPFHADGQGNQPRPGDISLCWQCKNVAIYTDTMGLRVATEEEWEEVREEVTSVMLAAAMAGAKTPSEALRAAGRMNDE